MSELEEKVGKEAEAENKYLGFEIFKNKTGQFPYKNKKGEEYVVKCRMPLIGDSIALESTKSFMTRGQYSLMASSNVLSQIEAVNLVDAIASIRHLCTLPKEFPQGDNLFNAEPNQAEDILDLYECYLKWQDFFREKMEGKSS